MRCPDCNKFVGLDEATGELQSLDIESDGQISAAVRIVRCCAECGTELKESTLDLSDNISTDLEGHLDEDGDKHELAIAEDGLTVKTETHGRNANISVTVKYAVKCNCDDGFEYSGEFEDSTEASQMDEM